RVVGQQADGDDVEVGQRPQHRPGEQGGASMACGRDGGGYGASKQYLGQGIHRRMLPAPPPRRHVLLVPEYVLIVNTPRWPHNPACTLLYHACPSFYPNARI